MALIPPDAGLRMRMQAESAILQPATAVQEIPADLPELRPGQAFTARIQQALPENTYLALVAGKSITLSLPQGAKAGDVLELVVVDHTPKLVLARLAQGVANAATAEHIYPHATLSPAGQLIGRLLAPAGQNPEPAQLNQGQPLLSTRPAPGTPDLAAQLAPKLQAAVNGSGLFYEAHQAHWVAGEIPSSALLEEPQGRASPALRSPSGAEVQPTQARLTEVAASKASAPEVLPTADGPTKARELAANTILQSIPEQLRPLVQQQLDAVATQRMLWHGEVWPGQNMEWEVSRDSPQRESAGEPTPAWNTRISLTSPALGRVDAGLNLTSGSLRIQLVTASPEATARMQAASGKLAESMAAAGLPVPNITVRHDIQPSG